MSKSKKETINYLTDLMGVVQNAYFKGRDLGVLVHESDGASVGIDLYNFDGDGKPVCEGLTFSLAGENRRAFCICYDPDEEEHPLCILSCDAEDGIDGDTDMLPEDVPEEVLTAITQWLEKAMKPAEPEKFRNDVTSFFFYMWNAWCEEECKVVFKDDFWPHFWNKWCHFCEKHSRFGAVEEFYAELSNDNRDKLVKRALEVYEGNHDKRY